MRPGLCQNAGSLIVTKNPAARTFAERQSSGEKPAACSGGAGATLTDEDAPTLTDT